VRIARAYRSAGAEAVEGFRTVLTNIIDEADRGRFERPDMGKPLGGKPASGKSGLPKRVPARTAARR
jgi:hypothetical protein